MVNSQQFGEDFRLLGILVIEILLWSMTSNRGGYGCFEIESKVFLG